MAEVRITTNPPGFTGINYAVCQYCKYRVVEDFGNFTAEGCKLTLRSDGTYTSFGETTDLYERVNKYVGCNKFESSGLPAHPSIIEKLVELNPLCRNIPLDPNAIETSHEMGEKSDKYLSSGNIFWGDITNRKVIGRPKA